MKLDWIDKTNIQKILERQSKITFRDKTGEYENFKFYTFINEICNFTKTNYVIFCVLNSSNLLMHQ